MRRLVAWENIERYRRLIARERDECRRETLQKLLAMEAVRWGRLVDEENAPEAIRAKVRLGR